MKQRLRNRAVAVVAIGGLAACASNPSARTVAEDMIDALPRLNEEQRICLREQLEGMDDAQLQAVAAAGQTGNFGTDFSLETTDEPFQTFVEDLQTACIE